ncbi:MULTISPECIES: hypothetical protein [unclassified Bradyrhizobium]|uniref:hypothetical protein n=1 Tax=unclassified Bradyrhizobium TaxID=2631580 RepID=UPI001FFB1949|nr:MULTISPECIES: hypothetical protein [unclassified Bradyrhizobium]MCK1266893.1 hypothetical protein [Bradyrhizobium sp. 84]MCK1316864.1 hypothetical protein [Bradyrhizobium sp. 23]MCK1369727.1 hypothetical protein [Bradyrhizobium sp. 49]
MYYLVIQDGFPAWRRIMSDDLEKAERDLAKARADLERAEALYADAEKEMAKARGELAQAEEEIEKAKKNHIEVSISTTAGFYPADGFNPVPENQPIQHELDKAKKELNIKDVTGWIASVITPAGKRTLDPSKSYVENGLNGKAEIDWGPSEGGGG